VKQVLIIPRNGYINRLQAIASAQILANQIDAELKVAWVPQVAAPAQEKIVFNSADIDKYFISEEKCQKMCGFLPSEIPRYLKTSATESGVRVVTLAGYDLGEQYFMRELRGLINTQKGSQVIAISAGGRFSLESESQSIEWDSPTFQLDRFRWYSELKFHEEIESAIRSAAGSEPYLGLHLRYSDRSHQTPTRREINEAVQKLAREANIRRIFIASDSRSERERWSIKLKERGFSVWWYDSGGGNRNQELGALGALIDWRLLGMSKSLVYFKESSYGYEAAVSTKNFSGSLGLEANRILSLAIRGQKFTRNAITVPKRRGWASIKLLKKKVIQLKKTWET
jgi:hypothetical protein